MNIWGQILFNLTFNSAFSFFAGLWIVFIVIKIFKIEKSRWKLIFLMLPFLKIFWDLFLRGIPTNSILYSGINPLMLPPKSQTLTIGGGFSQWGPIFNLLFTAESLDEKKFSQSVADYLYVLSQKYFGFYFPMIFLVLILGVSFFLIIKRWVLFYDFEKKLKLGLSLDQKIDELKSDFRKVGVYVSGRYFGTPFTGGIFRPYIFFPKESFDVLQKDEQNAVIKHELAHVKTWDLLFTFLIKATGDFFWFIPGYRFLSRKIDRLREVLADRYAVQLGAKPLVLASALLKLSDIRVGENHSVLHSAFFREKALLKERIESLVDEEGFEKPGRFGWKYTLVKVLLTFWVAGGVMLATLGGNHDVEIKEAPEWLMTLLKSLGWM